MYASVPIQKYAYTRKLTCLWREKLKLHSVLGPSAGWWSCETVHICPDGFFSLCILILLCKVNIYHEWLFWCWTMYVCTYKRKFSHCIFSLLCNSYSAHNMGVRKNLFCAGLHVFHMPIHGCFRHYFTVRSLCTAQHVKQTAFCSKIRCVMMHKQRGSARPSTLWTHPLFEEYVWTFTGYVCIHLCNLNIGQKRIVFLVCVCVCVYIYIYIHTHTHTHIHTHAQNTRILYAVCVWVYTYKWLTVRCKQTPEQ